jgi:selenocysteine-specific elongation factor
MSAAEQQAAAAGAAANAAPPRRRAFNINIGILGHVDSGKTSLARALSTKLSTAALDKHPQSKARGITLDLGFSAFSAPMPERLRAACKGEYDELQFTLVDCPGHASLIRHIIGGAQIIDLMLLVIDATKGIQTQTAECLVIGEILTPRMIVVVNKVDRLADTAEERSAKLDKLKRKLRATFAQTKFGEGVPMVATTAAPGADESAQGDVRELVDALLATVELPVRDPSGPFFFSIDHCFRIGGQGTVMTGTVLSGRVRVGDTIELPSLKEERKVRSMQMFKEPVDEAKQGDRVGICVQQLDPALIERGVANARGTVTLASALLARVSKVRFFRTPCKSKTRLHISVGHSTVMGEVSFFVEAGARAGVAAAAPDAAVAEAKALAEHAPRSLFDLSKEYEHVDELSGDRECAQYALLLLDEPILVRQGQWLLGSRLDADIQQNSCRIALSGRVVGWLDFANEEARRRLLVFRRRLRTARVERVVDDHVVIARGLLPKGSDVGRLQQFVGCQVEWEGRRIHGIIEGTFGTSGKFKVRFRESISAAERDAQNRAAGGERRQDEGEEEEEEEQEEEEEVEEEENEAGGEDAENEEEDGAAAGNGAKVKSANEKKQQPVASRDRARRGTEERGAGRLLLRFKKYLYAPSKRIVQ